MRSLLSLLCLLLFASCAEGTVAFDAFNSGTSGTGDLTWTHTPVGTPAAALVVIMGTSGSDTISGVTYGGTSMTEVTGSPVTVAGENGDVYLYFLGSSVPAGAQTVTVTVSAGGTKFAASYTLTAGDDVEVVDSDGSISSTSLENPAVTLSHGGRSCFDMIVFFSGQGAVTSLDPLTDWNARLEVDHGSDTGGTYSYDIIDTTDVTAGWTQAADDAGMIAVAVAEVAAGGATGAQIF